jgi:hypothetical protein
MRLMSFSFVATFVLHTVHKFIRQSYPKQLYLCALKFFLSSVY